MSLTFWAGRPQPNTTHEALAHKKIIEYFNTRFAMSSVPVFVVFDFYCGADLDLAVFTPHALVIVELKECAVPIHGAENGAWSIQGDSSSAGELKGGRYGNPFQQVKQYRYTLMDFLGRNKNGFLARQKADLVQFDHVTAVVAISPALDRRSSFDMQKHPWFHIVGLDELAGLVESLHSSHFSFSEEELRRLVVDVLRCNPMGAAPPAGVVRETPAMGRAVLEEIILAASPEWQEITGPSGHPQWHKPVIVFQQSVAENLALQAKGDAESLLTAGVLYEQGARGIPINDVKAIACFRAAAAKGNLAARVLLWEMYVQGRGIPAGELPSARARALQLLRQAAEVGYGEAAQCFGTLLLLGVGVQKNPEEAYSWLAKAADLGWSGSALIIGKIYLEIRDIPNGMSWIRKAAELGHPDAQREIGLRYLFGDGLERIDHQAAIWLEKAAINSDARAQGMLGVLYENGRGVEQSYAKAVHWYRQAIERGDAIAQNQLANLYANGSGGLPKDIRKALELYQQAAEQGHSAAESALGFTYTLGLDVAQNRELGKFWVQRGASHGDVTAQILLAYMHEKGDGVEKNDGVALHWYTQAAAQKDPTARAKVDTFQRTGRFS
jgi:TPR repeat protein